MAVKQLFSQNFSITLSERPGIREVRRAGEGTFIHCDPASLPSVWMIYDPETRKLQEIADNAPGVTCALDAEASAAVWHLTIPAQSGRVEADVCLKISGDALSFTVKNVQESPRAHLVAVRLNGLAAASQADAHSRLAMPSHGGRLIDPAVCGDGATDHRFNWILDSFGSAAVVYTRRMTAVVRIHLMDDQLTTRVGGESGQRYAEVGALLRRRYTCLDVSYRKAKPERDPANLEDAETLPVSADFLVCEEPFATVELLAHEDVTVEGGWTIGAQCVRESLPGKRTDYYRDKMVYKIFVGAPNQPVATDLKQIRSLVFDVAARTGNAGQIPYLVGFQHRGHDDAYPDVYTLNPALESMDALEKLVKDAEAVNCFVSFHDNFDDAYAASPSWDAEDISRDHTGHLLRGGVWNGVQAYWNSMPFYAKNRAEDRIRRTMATYPFIKDTYHLDVLTASVFRIDFRGEEPTGREADKLARLDIVEKFRAHGLDVTSESCGLPFVGTISYFWHMQRVPRELYPGDKRIPMVTFFVHGKADYAGSHSDCLHNIMDGLLYGGFFCNDITAATPIKQLTDAYFMLQYPLNLLRDDKAVSYEEHNGWKTVRYASGAEISVQFETEECRVTIGGQTLIENGTAILPQQDGSTILYRCQEEPYTDVLWQTDLPAGTKLCAVPMGVSSPERLLTVGEDGCVPVDTDLGVAYRVKKVEA